MREAAESSRLTPQDRPLNIAVVRQKYRVDGGAEQIVSRLFTTLREHGHTVTVIARAWDGTPDHVIHCNPPRVGRILRDWLFARSVRKQVARHEFDLVQSHERIPGCQVYRAGDGVHRAWIDLKRRTLPRGLRWWLNVSPYHQYLLRTERRMFEHPALRAVICNSRMVLEEIQRHFHIDPARLHLIYNGVDTARFHPDARAHRGDVRREQNIPDHAPLFLFVGSGFQRKGLGQVIQALKSVPRAHLLVVGRDKSTRTFQRQAARQGVLGRVHFAGIRSDVTRCYGAADAFVLPAFYDPFPNVILEAMASGLPVITSTTCGGSELITPGVNGDVRSAFEPADIAAAMQQYCDPLTATRQGAAARATVEPLTLDAMQHRLTTLYATLLNAEHGDPQNTGRQQHTISTPLTPEPARAA